MKFLVVFAFTLTIASVVNSQDIYQRKFSIRVEDEEIGGRITNGQEAAPNQFPYQAGLILQAPQGKRWCGGSLIDKNWILTAAHCTESVTSVTVQLGSIVRTSPTLILNVSQSDIIIHPKWSRSEAVNDISLIHIPSVTFDDSIQPVALSNISTSYPSFDGVSVIASGWGYTTDSNSSVAAPILQYAVMKVISNDQCKQTYDTVTDSNICVATTGGVSTCDGDSGGPLVLTDSKVQIGLTSYGSEDGCTKGIPVVFTRLTSFLDWIKEQTESFSKANY